jgi:hypothetical protein
MSAPPIRPSGNRPPPAPVKQQSLSKVVFGQIPASKGQRIVLYGTGGIGKSTLACLAPGPVAFLDADESLAILKTQLVEQDIPLPILIPANDWKSAQAALQADGYDKVKTIVIDTATKLEEWSVAHTIATVKHEKGNAVTSIEGYGFGKGFQHNFETFMKLLAELDRHIRAGRNVILIAHECTSNVPNPRGEDWTRYEPRLQSPKSGTASIRARLKEWADHVLFLGYDVAVKDGKAQGSGTRTLYTAELPFCMAKSRTTNEQIDITLGESPWDRIIK